MVIAALLTHTFTVCRRLRLPDGQGGWSESWAEVGTIRGRLRPRGASARDVADQEQAHITHTLYCLAGADVWRGDRLEGAGRLVEVLAVREPSHAGHHLEIDCREVQREGAAWLES